MNRVLAGLLMLAAAVAARAAEPFDLRGYYLTFMRMPVMGLPEWKEAVDCFADDGANALILWMGGGFRSKKFPVTWRYNEEHVNVRQDFVRELIDYAHTRNIRVLLGFTPFGYDGVNQFPLEQPELKARKPDGTSVERFGIHCWGWSLCPAKEESQRLMREYVREMWFDFYPNADGLLVESSDYNVCRCPECGAEHYDHEFTFVRALSEEIWRAKPDALILVYPHYFTGKPIPGLSVSGAQQAFDSRWGLFFTPHSAHFDAALIAQARTSVFWSDAPVLGTPERIASAAKEARHHGVTGFMPSFEAFSYVASMAEGGEPYLIGKRMRPLGLDALGEGRMPYRSLLARMQRLAFREFSRDPELEFAEFRQRLHRHLFGDTASPETVDDLLDFHRIWNQEGNWYWASPLLDPDLFRERARRLNWPPEKLAEYAQNLEQLRVWSARYEKSADAGERELARLAGLIVQRWGDHSPSALGAAP